MKTSIYNLKAENIGEITLPKAYFDVKASDKLIALAIRIYLANQRSAHAKTKERSDVSGTMKKMWAQKGTGRARHSTAKAPQFVGGGVAHGPSGLQNFKLNLPKKQKKLALTSLLTKFAQNKSIMVVDGVKALPPKTKEGWNFIDLLEKENKLLADSKKIGIVTSQPLDNITRAFGNIPGINLLSLKSLNVYDLSKQNFLIFTKNAVSKLSK